MSDDTTVAVSIPFALPYPGGSSSTLWVCSNGFVSLADNGSPYTPSASGFLGGPRTWAALWHDLVPSTGMVKVDTGTPSVVRISYTGVPNYGASGTATFQFQFFSNGNVNVIYQGVGAAGNEYLVGYTPGNNAPDPGSMDISAGLAGTLALCSGVSIPNVALTSSARPVIGTTLNLTTTNIPAGTLLGLQIFSLTQYNPGLDLAFLGMPGCRLYLGLDVMSTFPTPGTSAIVPYSVPSDPSLSGILLMSQSATLTPGINAFGFATSNGVSLLLGIN